MGDKPRLLRQLLFTFDKRVVFVVLGGVNWPFLAYFRSQSVISIMSTIQQNIVIHVDYTLQSENVVKCKQHECLVVRDILFLWHARIYTL